MNWAGLAVFMGVVAIALTIPGGWLILLAAIAWLWWREVGRKR